jgi:ubiquitin-conjugating enzyme E2 Q
MNRPFYQPDTFSTRGYVKQDAHYTIKGSHDRPVHIPIVALPRARQNVSIDDSDSVLTTGRNDGLSTPEEALVKTAPSKRHYDIDDISLFLGNESDGDDDMLIIGSRKRNGTHGDADRLERPSISRVRPLSVISISSTESIQNEVAFRNAFDPTKLDFASLKILPPPEWAAVSRAALRRLSMDIKNLHEEQATNTSDMTGYHVHTEQTDNLFQWIVQLHSFDKELPLAKDMERDGCSSIVLELRFGPSYPLAPPFVRVIRPRFVPFMEGGGGHVTQGGAMCLELLTTNGWNPAIYIGNVLTQIRAALCETERPARLATRQAGMDYAAGEAATAFVRLATAHGWGIPDDFKKITQML